MRNTLYILFKYWKKHIRNALHLMFAGILMVVIILVSFLNYRTTFNRQLHGEYDLVGMYDIMIPTPSDELLHNITDGKDADISTIDVLGKTGINKKLYYYGCCDDKTNQLHLPMESGRMPLDADEIAIERNVLNEWNWAGTLGDSITLDNKKYKIVGIIDKLLSENRNNIDIGSGNEDEDASPHPIPLIYVSKPDNYEPEYNIVMINGVVNSEKDAEYYFALLDNEFGENARWTDIIFKGSIADSVLKKDDFRYDTRFFLYMAFIASVVAVLSVLSVLKSIFIERRHFDTLLYRIGYSKKQKYGLYCTECLGFIVIQTIIGSVIGVLFYNVVFNYQVNKLDMTPYSALDCGEIVKEHTYNPFIIAVLFSTAIIILAYILAALSNCSRIGFKTRKKRPGSLTGILNRVFRQRAVSVIQTIALTFICFATLIGYMYYTDNGKKLLDGLKFTFPETYQVSEGFDMEKDGIEEYYYCAPPSINSIQSYQNGNEEFILADNQFSRGIGDDVINSYSGITATGELKQTFIISDTDIEKMTNKIQFSEQEQRDFITEHSDPEYKNFFKDNQLGTKHLYRLFTKLTSTETIQKLTPYITEGSINIPELNDGKEVIVVLHNKNEYFKVGDSLKIGSSLSNGSYGIAQINTIDVKIGAIVVLPDDADKLLRYAVNGTNEYNMLTTSNGAKNLRFDNAAYTEIFSPDDIDGGSIPSYAEMNLKSYSMLVKKNKIKQAMEYGATALLVIVMLLLGFSAYFSGIGIKIRIKEHQISVLRAMGASKSKINRSIVLSNLTIPFISMLFSGLAISYVQKITEKSYNKMLDINNDMSISPDKAYKLAVDLQDKFFLDNQLWMVSMKKPICILFAFISVITVLLTLASLYKTNKNIAYSLNSRRERK